MMYSGTYLILLTMTQPRFVFLSKNFNYSSRILSMATKIVVNQLIFTPVFNVYFFGSQSLLSGNNLSSTAERLKHTVPTSFVNAWKVWPAVTFIAFSYVPMEFRSIFTGVVAIGWQTYLSHLNRQAELKAARDELPRLDTIDNVGTAA